MKVETRTREIVNKQVYKVYIANDGTEFTIEQACQQYDDGAECAYRTLLSEVLKPIMGSFRYQDIEEHPELVNNYKNIIDDIFDDGRRECEYYTFKPQSEDDVKNFIALTKVQNADIRKIEYEEISANPYTQLEELKVGGAYIVIYYAGGVYYCIIEASKFAKGISDIIAEITK